MEYPLVQGLFLAIAKTRHAGWYRESCAGACPYQGARSCAFLNLWSEYAKSFTNSQLASIRALLQDRILRGCCLDYNAADDNSVVSLQRGLCLLHSRQAAWRIFGASCEGVCCEKYAWPTKEASPLLYVPHTTPRQAVVLIHFGLHTKEDVAQLISTSMEVAILVAHLLHHQGNVCRCPLLLTYIHSSTKSTSPFLITKGVLPLKALGSARGRRRRPYRR